jgi:hypothetical protein
MNSATVEEHQTKRPVSVSTELLATFRPNLSFSASPFSSSRSTNVDDEGNMKQASHYGAVKDVMRRTKAGYSKRGGEGGFAFWEDEADGIV